jgi:NitT/TauT family transport system substrate-binding protein
MMLLSVRNPDYSVGCRAAEAIMKTDKSFLVLCVKNRFAEVFKKELLSCICLCSFVVAAHAEPFTFLTSWYAQTEHGGYYEAKALGLYEKDGLDVTIRMGGPQINGTQLLLAGEADAYSGFDFQTLSGVERKLPLVAVGASFQHDIQGMMTHTDVAGLADLKGRTILMATSARTSWWPWFAQRFGASDDQAKPYTASVAPFLADPMVAQQAYPFAEPFAVEQAHVPYHFFLFADAGYPPYGGSIVTTQGALARHPDVLKRFLHATMLGWRAYLADPAPGNALIKADNPRISDAQLEFGIAGLRKLGIVDGGDARESGIGTMTAARWLAIHDYMVGAGLLNASTDWHAAYTTELIDQIKILPN